MKRSLLNIFNVLSCLVAVMVAGLLVRSFSVSDICTRRTLEYHKNYVFFFEEFIETGRGRISLYRRVDSYPASGGDKLVAAGALNPLLLDKLPQPENLDFIRDGEFRFPGMQFFEDRTDNEYGDGGPVHSHELGVACSLFYPLAIFSVPPALGVLGWLRRARRNGAGLCGSCGYDLRASADRCPECGKPLSNRG